MARHKSFGNVDRYRDQEAVTFDLYDETFTCKPAVQGAALLRFGTESQENAAEAVMTFFALCMGEEEFDRFKGLIESEDKIVDATTLGEIAGYLVGEYSSRPTERSSSSPSGPAKKKAGSARAH